MFKGLQPEQTDRQKRLKQECIPVGYLAPALSHMHPTGKWFCYLLQPSNEVCEDYVFTHVCQSTGLGGGGGIPTFLAGLQGLGCVSKHALQVSRPTSKGELEGSDRGGVRAHTQGLSPGPHPGGVSQHALRQTPQMMTTAVGSMHPNGMHSCFVIQLVVLNTCCPRSLIYAPRLAPFPSNLFECLYEEKIKRSECHFLFQCSALYKNRLKLETIAMLLFSLVLTFPTVQPSRWPAGLAFFAHLLLKLPRAL